MDGSKYVFGRHREICKIWLALIYPYMRVVLSFVLLRSFHDSEMT
jgi:hypothetical protein